MNLTQLQKFFLAKFFNLLMFFAPVLVIFFLDKGFTSTQTYKLIAFLSLMLGVLEYPTGVVADYFGHKISHILGTSLVFISYLLFIVSTNIYWLVLVLFLVSVGRTLESGSDVAILHSISKNFKKDYATYVQAMLIAQIISGLSAGFLYSISPNLVWIFSAIPLIFTIYFLAQIKANPIDKKENSLWKQSIVGLKTVINTRNLFLVIIAVSIILEFRSNTRFELNSLAKFSGHSIRIISIFIVLELIMRVLGAQLSKKLKRIKVSMWISLAIASMIFSLISFKSFYLSISLFILTSLFVSVASVQIMHDLNKMIEDNVRASVLSFQSLVRKLLGSGLLIIIGYVLQFKGWEYLILGYIGLFVMVLLVYFWSIEKNINKQG